MIKKIGIKNFRVFKDYAEFEIRPITILTGPNNSGKSSFTKLLLLLKNGIEELDFFEGEHNLISYWDNLSWDVQEGKYLEFLTIKLFGLLHGLDNDIESEFNFVDNTEDGGALKEFYINIGKEKFIFITAEEGFYDDEPDDSINFSYSCDFNPLIDLILSKKITIDAIPLDELSSNYLNTPELSKLTVEKVVRYKSMMKKEFSEKSVYDDVFFLLDSESNSDNSISKKEYDKFKEFNKENLFSFSNKMSTKEKGLIINNLVDQLKKEYKLMFSLFINGQNITKKYEHLLKRFNGTYSETGYVIGGDDFFVKNICEELKSFSDSLNIDNCVSDFEIIKNKLREDFNEDDLKTLEFKPTTLHKFLFSKNELFDKKSFWEWMIQDFGNLKNRFKDLKYIKANRGNQNRVLFFNSRKDIYDQLLLSTSKKIFARNSNAF